MLSLLFAFVATVTGCCFLMIGPTIILWRLGYPRTAFAVAAATTSALLLDYLYNWEGLSYPHWLMSAPTELFPLTFLCGVFAIGIGIKATLDRV